jgi:hypothetical protein
MKDFESLNPETFANTIITILSGKIPTKGTQKLTTFDGSFSKPNAELGFGQSSCRFFLEILEL